MINVYTIIIAPLFQTCGQATTTMLKTRLHPLLATSLCQHPCAADCCAAQCVLVSTTTVLPTSRAGPLTRLQTYLRALCWSGLLVLDRWWLRMVQTPTGGNCRSFCVQIQIAPTLIYKLQVQPWTHVVLASISLLYINSSRVISLYILHGKLCIW